MSLETDHWAEALATGGRAVHVSFADLGLLAGRRWPAHSGCPTHCGRAALRRRSLSVVNVRLVRVEREAVGDRGGGPVVRLASLNTRGVPVTGSRLARRYAAIGAAFEAGDAD